MKANMTYFSPVWILTCLSSCDCFMNAFGHDGQRFIEDGDFSPEAVVAALGGIVSHPPERQQQKINLLLLQRKRELLSIRTIECQQSQDHRFE